MYPPSKSTLLRQTRVSHNSPPTNSPMKTASGESRDLDPLPKTDFHYSSITTPSLSPSLLYTQEYWPTRPLPPNTHTLSCHFVWEFPRRHRRNTFPQIVRELTGKKKDLDKPSSESKWILLSGSLQSNGHYSGSCSSQVPSPMRLAFIRGWERVLCALRQASMEFLPLNLRFSTLCEQPCSP